MKHVISLSMLAIIFLSISCNNANNSADSVDSANKMNREKDSTNKNLSDSTPASLTMTVDKDDADFAVKAANGGMMEVEFGKMAADKGMSQRVKNFGNMMVTDHSDLGYKLKTLAKAKNISLPATLGADEQKKMDDLSKKTGKDFDKAYLNMMVDDHKKDLKEFQKQASNAKDMDLRNFASDAVPVIQKHIDSLKAITGKQ